MSVQNLPAAPRSDGGLVVAGVGGGVGTTTIATALGLRDRGVFVGRAADVLVCRAAGDSLIRAGYAAQLAFAWGQARPIVAVTAADLSGASRPTAARLRLLEPHTAAVIILPFVRRWRELAAPLDEVRDLLRLPLRDQPRGVRPYAAPRSARGGGIAHRSPAGAPPPPGGPAASAATAHRTPSAAITAARSR